MIARRTENASLLLNLAPLVDVMMCLLVFFMLATKMLAQTVSPVTLPVSTVAQPGDDLSSRRIIVEVLTAADGTAAYRVNEQATPEAELLVRLERETSANAGATCYVRADGQVAYRHLSPIVSACAKLGLQRLTFATMPQESE